MTTESTPSEPEVCCDALLGSETHQEFYATNDEDFFYRSPEEAAEGIWDDGEVSVGDTVTVYALTFRKADSSDFLPPIAEYLTENAYDNIGESALEWSFTGEEDKALQDAVAATVDKWCADNKCKSGLWWPVGKSTEIRYEITSEDGGVKLLPNSNIHEN